MLGRMKSTIDLDADPATRAIKVEAARTIRSVRDIVDEALAAWLEAEEERDELSVGGGSPGGVPPRRRRIGRVVLRFAGDRDEGDLPRTDQA